MTASRPLSVLILIGTLAASLAAADWGQWRGPARDNRSPETGLLPTWPEGGPTLLWEAAGLGSGYATVAVTGERIYTTGERGDVAYAHALVSGAARPVWSVPVGKAGAPGWGGFTGPRSTPTVAGDALYVLGQYGELVCLRATDGRELWRRHLVDDLGGKRPEWGFSESVLVDGDHLICTPGGDQGLLAALDRRSGELLWRSRDCTDGAHYASVVKATLAGVPQYVQLTAAHVVGVAVDGRVLWQVERKGKTAVVPTPVIQGDRVYVASGYGIGSACFEVTRQGRRFTARLLYQEKAMANQVGGLVVHGDHVYGYCDRGGWTCQDLATGRVLWTSKAVGKGSLTYADGRLYLRAEKKGTVALIEASPAGFRERGRFSQPGVGKQQTWPPPVVAGGRLYLRDQDRLLCYDIDA